MNNFGLFRKKELSFILNNKSEFGDQLIGQLKEYCLKQNISIKELKDLDQEWDNYFNRIKILEEKDAIIISKTQEAKTSDYNGILFAAILIGLLVFFSIWAFITFKNRDFHYWYSLIIFPALIYLFYDILKQRSFLKEKSKKIRIVKLFKSRSVQLFQDESKIFESKIEAVNLFWTEDSEAGSFPEIVLEFKMLNRQGFIIDKGGNYLESFKYANTICRFLNAKLNIFYGNSPLKENIEL